MPLDRTITRVLVLGAGPIVIGQGCEFDYSGTQACRALREEGCRVILLNSNPATIMTDSHIADAVYIEPITPHTLELLIKKEQPNAILPTMGGQTALNCVKDSSEILKKYNVTVLGASLETIEKAENRQLFKEQMIKAGIAVPYSFCITDLDDIANSPLTFPLIVRSSFSLGGQGGGIAHDIEELKAICTDSLSYSPNVLIEEALFSWKEYELEIMKDSLGNYIVVCGIENVNPMGIHTGDSITVSPIQTLTDKEYQLMRSTSFKVVEAIGMEAGGCNVQFAIDPKSGKMICIEVNPRVSRSSALASKATGFPIAKIATKLSLGYSLDELINEGTSLPSSFEPTIDYVVTKIPRFAFSEFPTANQSLSTQMKSIGEVMAIGGTFKESFNKAISSLDIPSHFQQNESTIASFDPWFSAQIKELDNREKEIKQFALNEISSPQLYQWKKVGFSDQRLAELLNCSQKLVFQMREKWQIHPVYKRVDTCSGEFPSTIPYMYSTYEEECESMPTTKKKIVVLGSGPNRIGQGLEFDYCSVHAVQAIRDLGYESILINCNPETVSTDYDSTDRLYFDPLTVEHVREVLRIEKPMGTIIQLGGQTPLNIGFHLYEEGHHLLGTAFPSIDLAEDREKFRCFAEKIGLKQPNNTTFSSQEEAREKAFQIGFPMILRPSYVIGGGTVQVIHNERELEKYIQSTTSTRPILMEQFLEKAIEIDVDAICDGKDVFICGLIEHLDPTGIHSGDSLSFLFPYSISTQLQKDIIKETKKIGLSLSIIGFFNVQFAIYNDEIIVLEVNPRASRTIPLLSKTTQLPLVQIATKCILGHSLKKQKMLSIAEPKILGLKLPVFSFSQLQLDNEKRGPQMKSTGEVLSVGKTEEELFMKAHMYITHHPHLFANDIHSKIPYSNMPLELHDMNRLYDKEIIVPEKGI